MNKYTSSHIRALREMNRFLGTNFDDYIDFINCFHSCVYNLKSIFDVAPDDIKECLKTDFYPNMIKMMREAKQHTGDDFIKVSYSGMPGIEMDGGSLSIEVNEGAIFTFDGKTIPCGKYVFEKEGVTRNGVLHDIGVPTIMVYSFREVDVSNKDEKKYIRYVDEFKRHTPKSFIGGCREYYVGKFNFYGQP